MLEVESFLRDSNGDLLPIEQADFSIPDPSYIEGALVVSANGIEVVSLEYWDYIDQLWSYIINMLERLKASDSASSGFPDQPIELKFARKGSYGVLVQSIARGDKRSVMVEEYELLSVLREAGVKFFDRMEELDPRSASSYALERERLISSCRHPGS
ncbi:hypothetical protein IPZ58_31185 [Streptomyces roseoverticillatus]|uniref:hypothetical protein n=1 Tax=Streptomyces roseoverticillatus TaxID=66429 RepID=UPI001F4584E0|nr:hypothetical protein [Streptomyces roseoverticillatus]MCF3106004.1 hypothetical protein [Streptomyces roseoverticillatus]